jgi:hypothetical protein
MGLARAAHAAGSRIAAAGFPLRRTTSHAGRKYGQFLRQFFCAALGTGRSLPATGTDEDFAVHSALSTMKFINWHDRNLPEDCRFINSKSSRQVPMAI